MEINIDDMVSNIRAVDDNSLLTPTVLNKIVQTVLEAVEEKEEYQRRIRREQKITPGINHELSEYEGM